MDAVRAFNNELSSLYESKPPVSRAKMAAVTKSAIKAIKFYKHVVQSVEKFIMKCKAEYKIPGLYVIDSVVRQSRHQFGPDKDVFGPRFTKNIVTTFQCLLKCPPEEKCRVVRVLNLWQKNAVFPVEVIQPLLDLAADPTNTDSVLAAQRAVEKVVAAHQRAQGKPTNGGAEASLLAQQTDIVNTVTRLLQQTGEGSLLAQGQEVQLQQLQLLQQQLVMHTEMMSSKPQQTPPVIDNNLLAQIKLLTDQLLNKTDPAPPAASIPPPSHHYQSGPHPPPDEGRRDSGGEVKKMEPGFNRKLLDFDYGDSDEEEERDDNSHHIVGGVQKILNDPSMMMHIHNVSTIKSGMSESERMHHLEQQQEQFNKEIAQSQFYNKESDVIVVEEEQDDKDRNYDRDRRRSRRSRDRSRSPKRRKHSRSRSRERRRSRERDRHRRSRSEEEERERQREKERERKKNGLPPVQEKYISLCSTTLWFGHLAKHTTDGELRTEIQKYGTITNIRMVPPRGCAFVTMTQRRDAAKALDRLKGFKLNYSALKVAWAPNIGIKDTPFQDLFDKELGVTYIAWNKLPAEVGPLLEGAVLDEDSLPEHLKGISFTKSQEEDNDDRGGTPQHDNHPMPFKSQLPPYGGRQDQAAVQNSSQMAMIPPSMMMPPPGMPPPNMGQIPLPAGMMPSNPPQGLPPLMPPAGGPPNTPISLAMGVSMPQVSAASSLLGAVPSMSNSPLSMGMDGQMNRPPGLPLSTAASLIMPGHQPGIPSRPGFPPPGNPFGLPNMRPSFPGMAMRPPAPEMEDLKEWPSDDKLEQEALAEMEEDEDMDRRQRQHNAPAPMVSMPMIGMRMGFSGPMGPRGIPMQLHAGSPRPHNMMMGPAVSSPGILGLARPGMLGPRIMQPGGPQDPGDGMMRPGLHQGMMGQGAMGMRLSMGTPPGPRTQLNPGNLPMGQRHGVPVGAGIRGMMPGGSPIRIVLGPRPNLVRPGAPFGMGDLPSSQGEGPMGDMPQGVPAGGPQGPGLLPAGLMMGAALRGGRPGLLGPRPNLPVNGGFRFGPGPMGFMGPRPDMMRGPGMEPPLMEGPPGMMPTQVAGAIIGGSDQGEEKSPEYGESSSSPIYGEDFVSSQEGPAGNSDTDLRRDDALLSQELDMRASSAGAGEPEVVKAKRTRWSSGDKSCTNSVLPAAAIAEANGPTSGVVPRVDASAAEAAAAPNPNQIETMSDA